MLLFPVQGLDLQGSADGSAVYRNGQCSIGTSINLGKLRYRDDFLVENLSLKADVVCSVSGVPKAT